MTKIVLDYGHGQGLDFNRGGVFFNEGDNNFEFGKILKIELEKYDGVEIFETRMSKSSNPSLSARATMYNKQYPDLFLSVHSNAWKLNQATGVEAFYRDDNPNTSNVLLRKLVEATASLLQIRNRGVKSYRFAVLGNDNNAKVKMLLEMFFHDNESDSKKFLDKKLELARTYARTIAEYYGLNLKRVVIPETTTSAKEVQLYRVSVGAYANKANAEKMIQTLKNKGFSPYMTLETFKKEI